ncbi:hypothetical protein [Sandaracinus amylolyticus]|uniref:Uncharacterized protein n=1 Tax=Sandaracinus amylolyticus TaxID=927083 RepID=A0A0F6W796_9BACT|nr:hypothetical protein [Sandaracinus amylolyticus]AKF09108.1 hypothetical protein DB32_006257 [Sandaracinus amylolyticus]
MHARTLRALVALTALASALGAGCTVGERDPMRPDAAMLDGGGRDAQATPDAGPLECDPDSTVGASCTSTRECDDGCFCNGVEVCTEGTCVQHEAPCDDDIECTADSCNEEENRCEFVGRDEMCADEDVCNGTESCVPGLGCRPGLRLTCNDGDPCTVGTCDATTGCAFIARDLDGDGFADERCGGEDCNDDPVVGAAISPGGTEVCGNAYDDDCDGLSDYRDPTCGAANDTCDTAEMLPGPGTYVRTTRGAANNYALGCRPTGVDTVFRIHLDDPADVQVTLSVESGTGSVAIRPWASCASGPDAYCRDNEVLARDLAAGDYAVIVRTSTGSTFSLTVAQMTATPIQRVDVCNDATVDISAGGTFTGFFSDVNHDYTLSCRATGTAKDVAYRLVITQPSDVRLTASTTASSSTTTYLSLVRDCTSPATAIACVQRASAEIFRRSVAPGVYYVLLESSSTAATTWRLVADIQPAAMRNPGDACSSELDITNSMVSVPLSSVEIDYGTTCGGNTTSSRDASFSFTTTELRDVVLTTEVGGIHYVSVAGDCGDLTTETSCTSGTPRIEQRMLRVPAGTYHVTVSTALASGSIVASARLEPPTFPPANDTCGGATDLVHAVPATADLLAAGDDVLGCAAEGSPDAIHRLVITERRNVTLVARRTDGSPEVLAIGLRSDCATPSSDLACASGGGSALLNRTLDAGTYYVVVESSRGAVGPYSIVAYLAEP